MKVLVIQGSPRMEKGYTQKILEHFIKGMQEAGANVDIIYLQKQNILPCIADESCQYKTPGICIHKDEMKENLYKLNESELWLFASPVYYSTLTGQMKIFIDRMLPMGTPENVIIDGRTGHIGDSTIKEGKVALLSTCGLYEMDNFEAMVHYFKAFSRNVQRKYVGSILRPHPWAVEKMPEDVLRATYKAGFQLVAEGEISKDILDEICRPLLSLDEFVKLE